jgi:malonyl-CoA/methylmalonyl-CoA synthetase
MQLADLFDASFRDRRDDVALETEGSSGVLQRLTFGELDDRARRMAGALSARGLAPGDRVAVHLPNCVEFIDLLIACARSGYILVPVNVLYRERELAHIVADARPSLVVTTPDHAALFPAGAPLVDLDALAAAARAATPVTARTRVAGDDPVALVYTSGTTGRSKGAVLTHNNVMANTASLLACWRITSSDRYLAVLPLFHVHGLVNGAGCWLASGCLMRLEERFYADRAAGWFRDFRPTLFYGVPTIYVRLLELDPAIARELGQGMRLFVSGSAPLPAAVLEKFSERFGHTILERYGMSETLMLTSNLYAGERRAGTVGYPLPGTSLLVRDEQGNACEAGVVGQVHVRGPTVCAGYWDNAGATAAAFRDGWFTTGDLGALDADGCLTLHGRASDLIISGGFNVFPREIEALLLEEPGVREAAVVGAPDSRRGEVPIAYVVADDGVDLDAVRARCASALASFKAPRAVIRVDALPRNALGKVQKHRLPLPAAPDA